MERLISPLHDKLHFRTKELYLTLSAIEEAVNAAKEHHSELLDKLTAIEERLGELPENVEDVNPNEGAARSSAFSEVGGCFRKRVRV